MEKILHFTVPATPTPAQEAVIEAARGMHPAWQVMVWKDPIASDGYLLEPYWPRVNSGAQFADLLRLDVVYRHGGVYLDSDVKPLRPLDDLAENYGCFAASEDGNWLTNAAFGARKGHPAIRGLIDHLLTDEPDWKAAPAASTGPGLFTTALKWRQDVAVLPRETFYPYNFDEPVRPSHRHAFGEHMWAYSWQSSAWRSPSAARMAWRRLKRQAKEISRRHAVRARRIGRRLAHTGSAAADVRTDLVVVKTIHGYHIVADARDPGLLPELMSNGCYKFAEEAFLRRCLKGGDWVIDVGANVGSFALLSAQCVGPFGRVFAYEPNPRPYRLLQKSLVLNRMHDRVVQRPVAVGHDARTTTGSFSANQVPNQRLVPADAQHETSTHDAGGLAETTTVSTSPVRLDDEFPVDLPIRALTIRADGEGARVLRGAKRLLQARSFDFILLEAVGDVAGPQGRQTLDEIAFAVAQGYAPCSLRKGGRLVAHSSIESAIGALGGRALVLAA